MSLRRGGRVAEDARLESGYTERYRGFESLPHRHTKTAPSGRFFYGAEVRVRSLVGFGRSSGTIGPSFQALTALHDSALPNAQSVFKLACFSGPGGELNNFSNQPLDDRE